MRKGASPLKIYLSMVFGITILVCLAISGCSLVRSSKPATSTITATTTVTATAPTPTPAPIPEPTVTPTPTPTKIPTPTVIPTPTIPPELEGVPPERLQFTKNMLYLHQEASNHSYIGFNKIDDYLSRDQIISYGETGEGMSVIKHKDGTPAIALINCSSEITQDFKNMLSYMEKYDSSYLKKITQNGTVAFFTHKFDGQGGFAFTKEGLITCNTSDRVPLHAQILTESYGIKMYNLGGDYSIYAGFPKEALSSYVFWNLYKKTGNETFNMLSEGEYTMAKYFYSDWYAPVNFEDDKIQTMIKNVMDKNLAVAIGGSWAEIQESIKDQPDWPR